MFVTQRGLLYALPAGLVLLWHWREKYFRSKEDRHRSGKLPFWVELSLYESMPLFHMQTLIALSIVLVCLFVLCVPQIRGHVLTLVLNAFISHKFLVWVV